MIQIIGLMIAVYTFIRLLQSAVEFSGERVSRSMQVFGVLGAVAIGGLAVLLLLSSLDVPRLP